MNKITPKEIQDSIKESFEKHVKPDWEEWRKLIVYSTPINKEAGE